MVLCYIHHTALCGLLGLLWMVLCWISELAGQVDGCSSEEDYGSAEQEEASLGHH